MNELKPCPFCGGEASVKVLEYDDDCKVWGVFCESDLADEYSHGHFVDNYATEAEAIAAWNSRADRTCKFVSSKGSDYPPVCSACGYELGIYDCEWFEDGTYGYDGNYCPNCGCKVVDE